MYGLFFSVLDYPQDLLLTLRIVIDMSRFNSLLGISIMIITNYRLL